MVHLLPEDLALCVEVRHDCTHLAQDVCPAEARRHHHEDADQAFHDVFGAQIAIADGSHSV